MIGIIVALAISWVLLYLVEKTSLLALGFVPVSKRLKQFGIGFLVASILCVSVQLLESTIKSSHWILNEEIGINMILSMFIWDLRSVITEELVFRGAILYVLIKKLGSQRGILMSAIAFGIYHWFSF